MSIRDNRDQLVLATKYTNNYLPKATGDITPNYTGNGTKSMKLLLENSLKRLKTSYIDLFYLHIWDYTTSIPELMHGLNDLVAAGKVMYLGISDTPAWVVSKANQYARDHGLRQFSVYQGMWNVAMRDFERDIIPMALHEGMALAPYGVLNQGRFQTREGFRERERSKEGRNFIPLDEHDKRISGVLEDLAAKREGTVTILHMALAYVMQKAPYVFPIIGCRKVSHLLDNLKGLQLTLTQGEMDAIDLATGFKHGFPTNFFNLSLFDPELPQVMVAEAKDVKMTLGRSEIDWVTGPRPIDPNAKASE
jgi:aryl-alcohol dehydrogenase-like predicted oxidoreductase